jgi:hypothetical protein
VDTRHDALLPRYLALTKAAPTNFCPGSADIFSGVSQRKRCESALAIMSGITSFALLLRNLFALGANLLPAYGIQYLGADPFQLLMLYWMETAIIGFWMVLTLARLPSHLLGEVTVNGRRQHATNAILVKLFGGMTLCFMGAHFFFLWVLFSGDQPHHVTGPISFVREFVIASGAWVPLSLTFFAGFCHSAARPDFAGMVERQLYPSRITPPTGKPVAGDGVGPAVGGMLGRIAMMQVAVIIGAMLARSYGSSAPLLVIIGLKTLFGFERGKGSGGQIPVHLEFTSNGVTTSLDVNEEKPRHSSPE